MKVVELKPLILKMLILNNKFPILDTLLLFAIVYSDSDIDEGSCRIKIVNSNPVTAAKHKTANFLFISEGLYFLNTLLALLWGNFMQLIRLFKFAEIYKQILSHHFYMKSFLFSIFYLLKILVLIKKL